MLMVGEPLMADRENSNVRPDAHQNNRTPQQLQHPYNDFDLENLSFEGTDLWTLNDGFFDATDDILQPLSPFDLHLSTENPESVEEGGLVAEGQHNLHVDNPYTVGLNHIPDLDDGFQDLAPPSETPQSIIPDHYGFGYWLSICSAPGVAWIRDRVGSDEFDDIAQDIEASWAKQSKLEHTKPTSKIAEPEPQLAWNYCEAYFERSVDNVFNAVYKPEFERHLRAHLAGKMQYYDPTWYALRNVVYAAGCRIYRSDSPAANFSEVQKEAWGYFSNALSVHSDLLLTKPTLRSVRALLAMALFAEGFASPALSSGLVSNAALVAQSLGLHRQAADADVHANSEALQRCWLFWAVYCCENHVAQRCGRPSVINNQDITCEIPKTVHTGSTIDLEMFTYIIQTVQFYDQISTELLSTRALHETPEKMLSLVTQFDLRLQMWKESLPSQLQPPDFLKQFRMPNDMRALGLMMTHCSFYDLIIGIHSTFLYPWVIDSFCGHLTAELALKIKEQVDTSSHLVANAARSLIVIARSLDMGGAGTQSFMLHFPMHAFINLFIFVIGNPGLPSVQSDLALLDVAAGYFGQLEFVTGSKLSFPFARDIAALARAVVDEASVSTPMLPFRISK